MVNIGRKHIIKAAKVAALLFGIWAVITAWLEIDKYQYFKSTAAWQQTFKAEMEKKWHMSFKDLQHDSSGRPTLLKSATYDPKAGLDIVCKVHVDHIGNRFGSTMYRVDIAVKGEEKTIAKAAPDLFNDCLNAPLTAGSFNRKKAAEWVQSQLDGTGLAKTTIGDVGLVVWVGRTQKVLMIGPQDYLEPGTDILDEQSQE